MRVKKISVLIALIFPLSLFAQEPGGQIDPQAQPSGGNYQAEYQADLRACQTKKGRAETCCNDPMQCASGMSPEQQAQLMQLVGMGAMAGMAFMNSGDAGISPEGLAGICAMMGSLGSAGSGVNEGAAKVCSDTQSECSNACSPLAQKWSERLNSCTSDPNCADGEFLNMAQQSFVSHAMACDSLSVNIDAMKSQAKNTGGAEQMGQLCAAMASMLPKKEEEEQAQPAAVVVDCNLPENATNPLCIDCKADPTNKACGKPVASKGPGVGFSGGGGIGANDFNTGAGYDGINQNPQFERFQPKPNQSGTVSGQGGGILGGGNDGGGFGLDPQPDGEGGGYNTDILNGLGGGSGGSSVASMGVDSSGGFSGYGGGGQPAEEIPYEGMDLKKFLPDGALDPNRRLASTLVSAGEINDKNANIFEKISQRMKAVCNTKRLKDCQ